MRRESVAFWGSIRFHPILGGFGKFSVVGFLILWGNLGGELLFLGNLWWVCRSGVDHSIASSAWDQLCLPFEFSLLWFFCFFAFGWWAVGCDLELK